MGSSKAARALEGWVRDELCSYALALRKLAYTMPNGVGEHDLLQLSDQLKAAGRDLGGMLGSVSAEEPLESQTSHNPSRPTINEIRNLIPDWPDTHGIPWQMCAIATWCMTRPVSTRTGAASITSNAECPNLFAW